MTGWKQPVVVTKLPADLLAGALWSMARSLGQLVLLSLCWANPPHPPESAGLTRLLLVSDLQVADHRL